jgi:hypothetical protein
LTLEKLYSVFQVSDTHPFSDIVEMIFNSAKKTTEDDFIADYDYDVESGGGGYKDVLGKGYFLYEGYFSDQNSSPAEQYLCYTDLNITLDDFIMIHEIGY